MPGIVMNRDSGSNTLNPSAHGRWLDQQQYLVETYRQIRANLGQLEAEIEAARLRVTDWTRLRRQPSRSRSLSHASGSTTASSLLSRSTMESGGTDASFLNVTTEGTTTGSSCRSSCSSSCGVQLPPTIAAKLSAATLISAFLAASSLSSQAEIHNTGSTDLNRLTRSQTPDQTGPDSPRPRPKRSASPSSR